MAPRPLQEELGLVWVPQASVPPANSPHPVVLWFLSAPLCPPPDGKSRDGWARSLVPRCALSVQSRAWPGTGAQ